MPKNISISFSGGITICNLFNRLNRNTASRVISLFETPIKKIINFTKLFCLTIVLRKSSWGRMLASRLKFNTYFFSVTSIFHPCQAIHYNMLYSLQIFNHKLHGFNFNNLIRCMIKSRIDPD